LKIHNSHRPNTTQHTTDIKNKETQINVESHSNHNTNTVISHNLQENKITQCKAHNPQSFIIHHHQLAKICCLLLLVVDGVVSSN
jgi:hypothetical protein